MASLLPNTYQTKNVNVAKNNALSNVTTVLYGNVSTPNFPFFTTSCTSKATTDKEANNTNMASRPNNFITQTIYVHKDTIIIYILNTTDTAI